MIAFLNYIIPLFPSIIHTFTFPFSFFLIFLHHTHIPIISILFFFSLLSTSTLSFFLQLSFSTFFFLFLLNSKTLSTSLCDKKRRKRQREKEQMGLMAPLRHAFAPLSVPPHLPLCCHRSSSSPTQPRWQMAYVFSFLFCFYCYGLINFKIMFLSLYFDYT